MSEKPGRNDLCPCQSGKKFKNCCMGKSEFSSSVTKKKFTAKIISSGGIHQKQTDENTDQSNKGYVDYGTLLEKSYGKVWDDENETPPIPSSPTEYLPKEEEQK